MFTIRKSITLQHSELSTPTQFYRVFLSIKLQTLNTIIKSISFIYLTLLFLLFFLTLLSVLIQVVVISYPLLFLSDILDISIKVLDYLAIIIL